MKTTKIFAMATAALMMAACSSDEIESVAKKVSVKAPLEIVPDLNNQTCAGQITTSNLTAFNVDVTGTFIDGGGTEFTNPVLAMTKSGSDWSYSYTDANHATPTEGLLYWLLEGTDATFSAWYYEGGSSKGALDNRTATLDAVGAYATHAKESDATSVGLDFKHAVSKAVFKARMHEAATGTQKVKNDIKGMALRSMKYAATAYAAPSANPTMGTFTVGDAKRTLISPADIDLTAAASWVTESDAAATDLQMPMFVMPQAIAASDIQDLSDDGDWTGVYISVLAQIRLDETSSDAVIFPRGTGADKYAWIALPLPADFTGFAAHKKYVFTLNFRNDALGMVDKNQNPNDDDDPTTDDSPSGPDTSDEIDDETPGGGINIPDHSGFALEVTVTEVLDFDEDASNTYDVNKLAVLFTDLSMVDCAGNARASMSTANCYMVHTAGYYKLPLVYGNAIKDGADNTVAYNPGGTTSTNYCANFVNHAGNAITAPWIKDNGITVTQAELLWQDAQGLITAVGIDGDYLTLTVGKNAATQEGNALVAAKNADGTIVWSWYIWVTKQTFATLTNVTVSGYTYKMTPVRTSVGWATPPVQQATTPTTSGAARTPSSLLRERTLTTIPSMTSATTMLQRQHSPVPMTTT